MTSNLVADKEFRLKADWVARLQGRLNKAFLCDPSKPWLSPRSSLYASGARRGQKAARSTGSRSKLYARK